MCLQDENNTLKREVIESKFEHFTKKDRKKLNISPAELTNEFTKNKTQPKSETLPQTQTKKHPPPTPTHSPVQWNLERKRNT